MASAQQLCDRDIQERIGSIDGERRPQHSKARCVIDDSGTHLAGSGEEEMDSKKSGLFCVVSATVSVTIELKCALLPWDCSRWREREAV